MNLNEMRRWLSRREIQLTKSLGQNFLHDANQLQRIVDFAELSADDRVLEIGPGLGPLTERLLANSGHVFAIEMDHRLVEVLRERFPGTPGLELLHGDAMDWIKRNPRDWTGWKLVANLPYSVASPILVELAGAPVPPDRIVATLQTEVAGRLMSGPGSRSYGVLTLLVQLRFEPAGIFKIPSGCFFPEPDVESSCIRLLRRPTPLLDAGQAKVFTRIVKTAFQQRRKMMLKLLKQFWPAETLSAAFKETGIAEKDRAEHVSLEQYVALTKRLA